MSQLLPSGQPLNDPSLHRNDNRGGPPWILFADNQQRALFRKLMQQQFWLWGYDVRRADGNLLLANGFVKQRAPEGSASTSRYSLRIAGEIEFTLWGFGLFASGPGNLSVFLPRLSLAPRCGECNETLDGRWDPHDFRDLRRPQSSCDHWEVRLLLGGVFAWIGAYERRVVAEAGLAYRAASIAAWKRPVGTPIEIAYHFDTLAAALRSEARRFAAID